VVALGVIGTVEVVAPVLQAKLVAVPTAESVAEVPWHTRLLVVAMLTDGPAMIVTVASFDNPVKRGDAQVVSNTT
jgi:hypothetical protein